MSVADDDGTVVEVPPFVLTVEPEPGEERAAHCTSRAPSDRTRSSTTR
ncbi:MAG: hypothetical protein K8H88_19560 [Sandaracinaceae bacterium]|nr:hypothetical protein [Sandaracinaceae bacterium]